VAIIQRELSVQLPIFVKLTIAINMFHRIQRFLPTAANNFLHSRITQGGTFLKASDWRAIAGLIIGFGIILRFIPYLHNRTLWLDEALLALNILQKPFSQIGGISRLEANGSRWISLH
jgi:hypothetical protein